MKFLQDLFKQNRDMKCLAKIGSRLSVFFCAILSSMMLILTPKSNSSLFRLRKLKREKNSRLMSRSFLDIKEPLIQLWLNQN